MTDIYRTPEQKSRDKIDAMLNQAGWKVQSKNKPDLSAGPGIAVREYQTDVGPADYVLFVGKQAVGVVEAKSEDWGHNITTVETQSGTYAAAELKWVNNQEPLPFVYETTGVLTRFTNGRDPKPRSREIFNFPRPEIISKWNTNDDSLPRPSSAFPISQVGRSPDCPFRSLLDVYSRSGPPSLLNCSKRPFDAKGLQTISLPLLPGPDCYQLDRQLLDGFRIR